MYICALIYRGILWKPVSYMYFTTDKLFETPRFRSIISRDACVNLEKFIHFIDNESLPENYSKTAKIKPIFDYFVSRFQKLFTRDRDISINESLLLWKGRLSWKQYIPRKRSRFGLKPFVLCDAITGYVWNSILYSGKDTDGIEDGNADYHATRIVCSLAKSFFNKKYCIDVDNWFTLVELCKVLKENGCDIIGTLQKDRKGLPISVVKAKMKTGQRNVSYEHKLRVMCLGWKDKRDVFLMGTCINDS